MTKGVGLKQEPQDDLVASHDQPQEKGDDEPYQHGSTPGISDNSSDALLPNFPPPDLCTHLHGRWKHFQGKNPMWSPHAQALMWSELPTNVSFKHEHWMGRIFPHESPHSCTTCTCGLAHYTAGHNRNLTTMHRVLPYKQFSHTIVEECTMCALPTCGVAVTPNYPLNQEAKLLAQEVREHEIQATKDELDQLHKVH